MLLKLFYIFHLLDRDKVVHPSWSLQYPHQDINNNKIKKNNKNINNNNNNNNNNNTKKSWSFSPLVI
jgi:hypothetical protein